MRANVQLFGSLATLAAMSGPAVGASPASVPIRTKLEASFPAPPLLLEIAEGIATYNASAFFPFIQKLAENRQVFDQPDSVSYAQALEWITTDQLLTPVSLSLLKLELATHTYAPAVLAQYQLYNATVVPEIKQARKTFDESCVTWAQYKDKQACSVEALDEMLNVEKFYGTTYIEEAKTEPQVLDLDHVYQTDAPAADKLVVLYADPRANDFVKLHQHAKELAENSQATYVLRYRPWASAERPLGLSGYGVELALKSTEYKVIDDRDLDFGGERKKGGAEARLAVQDGEQHGEVELFASETEPLIKGLPENLMSSIGYQATQMILGAADKLAVLKQLSQDLPRYAHLLSEVELNTTLTDRIELFRQIAPHDMFLVNGLRLTPAELDPFKLLSHLRKENSIISALEGIGFTQQQALDLIRSEKLAQSEQPEEDVPTFDMRDSTKSVIAWLNDLEKDSRYGMWPKDLRNLARIFTPGQIQRIRQNIVQVVFALDLSSSASWQMILEEVMTNIEHGLPMQFGVVPLIDYTDPSSDSDANKMAKVYNYLRQVFGKKKVMSFWKGAMIAFAKNSGKMSFTENTRGLYAAFVKSTKTKTGDTALSWDQVISLSDEKLAEQWNASVKYCARLDLSTVSSPEGLVFVNGGAISLADNYQNSLFQAVQMQMWELAQALRRTDLDPEGNVQEYVYSRPGVMSTRSALIYPSDESPLRFLPLGEPAVQDWVDNGIPYLSYKSESDLELQTVTVWVVGDFAFAHARELAAKALLAAADDRRVRVGLIHSPQPIGAAASEHRADGEEDEEQPEGFSADMPAAVHQLISVSDVPADVAASFAERLLRSSELDQEILADEQFAAHKDVFAEIVDLSDDTADSSETAFALNQAALHTLGVPATTSSSSYLVVNGRILPPIPDDVPISADTVRALVNYELSERIDNVYKAVEKVTASPDTLNLPSLIMKATAILSHGQSLVKVNGIFQRPWADTRRSIEDLVKGKNDSLIQINDPATARFRIQAVLDPLSEYAQKWAPVFQALASLPSVSVEVYLNPSVGMKELPVKRFYRYLWPSELSFDSDGGVATPEVLFNGVPADPLLTLGMDVPAAWLVTAVESVHDLDNIRLSSVKDKGTGVSATYRLVNILVEGHCVDGGNRSPPRGLEVQLGTSLTPSITDTIVMANLGYLQLKANPGVWEFSIRDGRSNDIYRIDDISEGRWNYVAAKRAQTSNTGSVKPIVLSSFNGITIFPVVSKRAGKESEKLLLEKGAEESIKAASGSGSKGGLWGKLKGAIGGGVATTGDNRPHFDVFAVASGHLYERLMSIMILSVLKNTQSHVKFWLIENFLSPSFKAFVPHMAAEYGFDYEFVTYKWPHWLNHETEKQRTIWGYKILYLDVLFPLNLDRVIFVDADQIVRADLQELADMDLKGAPYGYVPFCDDRKEIEGYRFWKQGWWKDHLKDKPYHISALYVVDLKQFRLLAAGDRLRGQYQTLSRDSNSLANLDQDLPNNMQHIVPIHSLPQEWLWCETWCSDGSLKKAKTIDLCNNPMTKEPKLERARRLLPEWEVYDKEVANFTKTLAIRGNVEGAQIAEAEAVVIDQHKEDKKKEHDEL